jgi:hypothetical protein
MNSRRILKAGESYTFSRYFELPFTIDDILAELDCTIERKNLTLPESSEVLDIQFLQQQLRRNLSHIDLVNETTRREALIGPILFEVCDLTNQRLNIEPIFRTHNCHIPRKRIYLVHKNYLFGELTRAK